MAHDLLSGKTTSANWARHSAYTSGNDDLPSDPKPLMEWIEKRNKEIEQQAAQGDPQAIKAMDRIRKNRALGHAINRIIIEDLKARAAQGDSEAQRKLVEKDRLLPISKKISADLLGKSAAELWDEAESQRLHKPVHQMSPRPGKSAAALWDEAESQRLHKPVHQMSPGTDELPPPEEPVSITKIALVGGIAVAGALALGNLIGGPRRK
jgi:hypothetical protein